MPLLSDVRKIFLKVSQEIPLSKGNLLTTLPVVKKEYFVSLDLWLNTHSGQRRNVFLMTTKDMTKSTGIHILGFWITPGDRLQIVAFVKGWVWFTNCFLTGNSTRLITANHGCN